MKKTYVAAIAILAAFVLVLAAAVALTQNQPSPSGSGSGSLAVMGTDPPVAASGVSDSTIAYSSVMAHVAGSDIASGWTQVSGSGSMDLMASQGTAQILATSRVNAATYDAFRFNVDSVKVVYQGQTYVATVASGTITAQSQSKVHVNSSTTAAAVVDMRTVIENTATTSNPQFVFSATAVATSVPPQTTLAISLQLGSTVDLSSQAWWNTFQAQTTAVLNVDAAITSNSMVLNLKNSGGADAEIQEIIVTPVSASAYGSASLPSTLSGSAVFTVSGSGSVQQASSIQASALLNGGATVASGSSTTLNYSGTISSNSSLQLSGVVTGQQYIITCIGANTYASTTVVAS